MGHGGPGVGFRIAYGGARRPDHTDHKLAKGTIPRSIRFASHYRWSIVGFLLVTIMTSFLAVVPALLIRSLTDTAIPDKDRSLVAFIAFAGIGVAILIAGSGLAGRYLSSRVGEGLIYDLRVSLFGHVQRMPVAFFTRTQTGSLISRLSSDVVGAQSALTGTLQSIVSSVITLVVTLGTMLFLDWKLTIIASLVLPLFVMPSTRTGRRLQGIVRQQMETNASMTATMQERFDVSGAILSKLFGQHDTEVEHFSNRAAKVRDLGIRVAVLGRTLFAVFALVAALGSAVIYWFGGTAAIAGRLSPGDVVAFVLLLGQLYGPIGSLATARTDLMTSFISFERVFEILDLTEQIADPEDGATLPAGSGRVEFRDVYFRYPKASDVSIASLEPAQSFKQGEVQVDVLHGVSFMVEPGQTVALVGPSGAGKTTISSLVPRLYDVTGGAVLVDGADVREVTQESLRAVIGVVSQDPHLFHDTVSANLRFAKPDATEEEIREAIKGAQLENVIAAMPDGLETVVGERGYRMSGGEKQRLAIARVLVKSPRVVILDEATAHLDSENEALVQQALRTALTERTALVIAHRLSTVLSADQILVLEAGKIVQRGTHATLVAQEGLYRELYRTQFAPEPAGTDAS